MKHSALFQIQSRGQARFTVHDSWEVPAQFRDPAEESARVREGTGLTDLSWMVKLDLKGSGLKSLPELGGEVSCWQLGFCHYLVTCDPVYRELASQRLGALTGTVYSTDVSSVYAQLLLCGPLAAGALRKLTSTNVSDRAFPPGNAVQTSLAHIRAIILRDTLSSLPAFHIFISREYAESAWESITHAGHESGLVPFGLDAYRLLMA